MKRHVQILLAILIASLVASCGNKRQEFRHPVLRQVHDQLSQSCAEPGIRFQKTVTSLSDETPVAADSTFLLNDSCQLLIDLQYAYTQSFLEPGIKDYFEVKQTGDTTVASIREGRESRVGIQSQKLVFSSVDSTLLFLEVTIKKRQFLYDMDAHLAVTFDSTGIYQSHRQSVDIRISGGNNYAASTEGKLLTP